MAHILLHVFYGKNKMGQQEIYNLLEKYRNKWFSAREIARFLNTSLNSSEANLRRLREAGIVMCKTVVRVIKPAGERPLYIYKYKKIRRMYIRR